MKTEAKIMNRNILAFMLLAAAIPVFAQEEGSGGIYGYTSIDYDQDSNTITAYSETDIDVDLLPYYLASVTAYVEDDQGNSPWLISNDWEGDDASYSETLQYSANGGQTYTAYGQHSAVMAQSQCQDEWCDTVQYWDPYNFLIFEYEDISDWGGLGFFGPGPDDSTDSPNANLGTTYDSATLFVPPLCGDVRDILMREYASYHSPFRPTCGDFMYGPWWQLYFSYYTNLELDTRSIDGVSKFRSTSGVRSSRRTR
jgi:hypothetical protein